MAAETQAIGLLASTSKGDQQSADQMTSMEVPENLTEVMMAGDDKENVKRKLNAR